MVRKPSRLLTRAVGLLIVVQITAGATFGVVGDSVTYLSRDELAARGADVRSAQGLDIREGRPGLHQLVVAGHDQIVVALGYMDARASNAQLARRIRPVLREVLSGVRCVLWVDLATSGTDPGWTERTARFNLLIRRLAPEFGAKVVPWSVFSRGHRAWFNARDGFHPNRRGQAAYARFIAAQVNQRC